MTPFVRLAHGGDFGALLALAGEVEHWFGAMVEEPGFHEALRAHIDTGMALVAEEGAGGGVRSVYGALLFGSEPPTHHLHWLVVSERARGQRVGRTLVDEAVRRYVTPPGTLEVVTFGADHPGATASGARVFYERLGFTPAEAAPPGPEGGSRQHYRRTLDAPGPLTRDTGGPPPTAPPRSSGP
ncbi:GNAT family N-acetyltransferase [Streptomyces iconiensis]|uniref:GNAT family N-acetyltransferase n=1 Tax=Streptomyces iconiensis TaxID=1384038 RepID=A0ABT6ZUV6_9ACTN|nr:GNAT family N-acetyltransferase [Streptomyces iconiensis]MDJ1132857.1 GNAT family N-acetyltransferase [Streptomyces iconiensis]